MKKSPSIFWPCPLIFMMVLATFTNSAGADVEARPRAGILYQVAVDNPVAVVVLSHDWFGDSPYYRTVGSQLAGQGFAVIASDLYRGQPGASDHAEAWALLKELTDEHAGSVLEANLKTAATMSDKIFLVGFSAGASHAMRAAVNNANLVDGVVVYYGDTIADAESLSRLQGPVLAIYGSMDMTYGETSAAQAAGNFLAAADQAGVTAEVHIFSGAAHAFAQPLFNAGQTYDGHLAEAAFSLTEDFIRRAASAR